MPIYEYECPTCGKVSEFIEKITGEGKEPSCRFCGRAERCDVPPCSSGGGCGR